MPIITAATAQPAELLAQKRCVGNVPLTAFPGPPPEVLAKLGLEQTVA